MKSMTENPELTTFMSRMSQRNSDQHSGLHWIFLKENPDGDFWMPGRSFRNKPKMFCWHPLHNESAKSSFVKNDEQECVLGGGGVEDFVDDLIFILHKTWSEKSVHFKPQITWKADHFPSSSPHCREFYWLRYGGGYCLWADNFLRGDNSQLRLTGGWCLYELYLP